jgi:hypothetical protein
VVACAASIVSAQVYSANIVGYATTTVPDSGFEIIAPQFRADDSAGIALGDVFANAVSGDQVLVYNGTLYDAYTYYGSEYGWYKGSSASDSVLIPEGASVWFKGSAGAEVMTAGEVPSDDSIVIAFAEGFNMVANPYPVKTMLSSIDDSDLVSGDQILVYNGALYDTYVYYGSQYGWYKGSTASGTVTIGVGQGFWLKTAGAGELVFNKTF